MKPGIRDPRLRTLPPRLAAFDARVAAPAPKRTDPFYLSPPWRALVGEVTEMRGRRCEACGKTLEADGSPVRLIADHVVERRDGGADLDQSNIRLLCTRLGGNGTKSSNGSSGGCHAAKTARARANWLASGRTRPPGG